MELQKLALDIRVIDATLKESAAKAINKHVTARNWLIGYFIVNYEQHGEDRAKYGDRILQNLSAKLTEPGLSSRNLRLFRLFYQVYPKLGGPIRNYLIQNSTIMQSLISYLPMIDGEDDSIWQSPIAKFRGVEPDIIFERLSYTHLVQLLQISNPLERTFYETECIKGVWSIRELKRQIGTNLYARTGLSTNKDKVLASTNKYAERTGVHDIIRSQYTFEFLGIKPTEVMKEHPLEDALTEHLKEFLLELGNGFCFEDRQRRILIDGEYYYYDLLFYNRLLHCGVIVELKSHPFDYADAAQMNMYLNYYKKNFMSDGDLPPIGLLLCTGVGIEKAEYTTIGMDGNLMIAEYRIALPSSEQMIEFLQKENQGKE